jgi:hypothetical protein
MSHEAITVIVAVLSILTAALRAGERLLSMPDIFRRKERHKPAEEDFEFISTLLSPDFSFKPPLVVEKGIERYFRRRYRYEEIVALLRFKNPTYAFHCLAWGRLLVQLAPNGQFVYKTPRLAQSGYRRGMTALFALLYVGAVAVALSPLFGVSFLLSRADGLFGFFGLLALTAALLALLIPHAFSLLDVAMAYRAAEDLMKEQAKRNDALSLAWPEHAQAHLGVWPGTGDEPAAAIEALAPA